MKWTSATVVINSSLPLIESAADHISALFYDLGLSGVVVEDPDMEPVEGWGEDALPKPKCHTVTGYLPCNDTLALNCSLLERGLADLKRDHGILSEVIYREVDEEDWAESWKSYFWPEKLTDILVVKPTWRGQMPKKDEIVIEIDPGMAFGTGTHPTTALCAQMIQNYLRPGNSFLDVGTGSGILMIAAAKLGASRLCGTDVDNVACGIATQNLLINHIDPQMFAVTCGNLADRVSEKFQVVSANILSEVILMLLNSIQQVLEPGGILICSGIIRANQDPVIKKLKRTGFHIMDVISKDEWVAIVSRLMTLTG